MEDGSMKKQNGMMKQIAKLGLQLMMGVSLSACAGLFGLGGTNWKEEVLLHDGSKVVVSRSASRGGRHEIGQRSPIKDQSLSFTIPGTNEKISWEDNFTEDVGGANFLPMQLEILNNTAYLVAYPMGCMSYNKWGRPNPPYVVFIYQTKAWQRITLSELPTELTSPNMIFSDPDGQVERLGKSFITTEMIQQIIGGYKQPEYKTILREPIRSAGQGCPKLISYGKQGGWIGLDWFTDQPSLEACLKFCDRKNISTKTCPCNSIFKGDK